MAGGTFTFIENINVVSEAFATCLGGLLSVVAQNIQVNIQPCGQHTITAVHSHFAKSTHPDGTTCIKVPDLYAEEKRDLMFSVKLPEISEVWLT